MSYNRHYWQNDRAPALNAENLNEMEQGIAGAHEAVGQEKTAREAAVDSVKENLSILTEHVDNIDEVIIDTVQPLQNQADDTERRLDFLYKLNKGQTWDFENVESEAYSVDVPSGAKVSDLLKVGGKSVVMNQRLNNSAVQVTGGIITAGGDKWIFRANASGQQIYAVHGYGQGGHTYFAKAKFKATSSDVKMRAFSEDFDDSRINTEKVVCARKTASQTGGFSIGIIDRRTSGFDDIEVYSLIVIDLTQMFGADNEPTLEECQQIFADDYYPYNDGEIKNADVNEVEVRGANLFDPSKAKPCAINDSDGSEISKNYAHSTDWIDVVGGEKYFVRPRLASGNWLAWYDSNKSFISGNNGYDRAFTAPVNAKYLRCTVDYNGSNPNYADNFMVVKSDVAIPFVPYSKHTIPTNLPVLRSAGTVHDEIDFENGKLIQRVGVVDLGTLRCVKYGGLTPVSGRYIYNVVVGDVPIKIGGNWLCRALSMIAFDRLIDTTGAYMNKQYNQFLVSTTAYSNEDELKTALNGVMLYYELADPIITDFYDILDPFEAESGGSITFKQSDDTLRLPVSNTMKYLVKLSEV